MKHIFLLLVLALSLFAQDIPASYSNLSRAEDGTLQLQLPDGKKLLAKSGETWMTLENLQGAPTGTKDGLRFDFNNADLKGRMYYGFIPYGDSRHPMPVFFKRVAKIDSGKTAIKIKKSMAGRYDMIGWEAAGKGVIGYRVVDGDGQFLYEGRIGFKGTGPFEIDDTIIEGPSVNLLKADGATIAFTTNTLLSARVEAGAKTFREANKATYHEIEITGLKPATTYKYTVFFGNNQQSFEFTTAPEAGSREPFTFAYASDSRAGRGGGERDMYGANFYILRKIQAINSFRKTAFMQFTGDLINGYSRNRGRMNLQFANWKRAVEPFTHYAPVIAGMGNHEAFIYSFRDSINRYSVDQFPYATYSAEAIFQQHFVNPLNGPDSEDGSPQDPNPETKDFPSYKENVFSYQYGNVAMIVLNSDYWYAPSLKYHSFTSGNLHAYIMDNQMQWLKKQLKKLEQDKTVDHIFITGHTPFFPNGGHVGDDMWYDGSNKLRAVIAGQPVEKGIIERRDQLLDLLVNKSSKVRAILTGDEHNYCRTEVGPQTPIYPENYQLPKIKLNRTIWQINNGAAGAPYYAQQQTPWTSFVKGFTTQNAVVYFHVQGNRIKVEVRNPDTMEAVDDLLLHP